MSNPNRGGKRQKGNDNHKKNNKQTKKQRKQAKKTVKKEVKKQKDYAKKNSTPSSQTSTKPTSTKTTSSATKPKNKSVIYESNVGTAAHRSGAITSVNKHKNDATTENQTKTIESFAPVTEGFHYMVADTKQVATDWARGATKRAEETVGYGNKGKSGKQKAPTKRNDRWNPEQKKRAEIYSQQQEEKKRQVAYTKGIDYETGEKLIDPETGKRINHYSSTIDKMKEVSDSYKKEKEEALEYGGKHFSDEKNDYWIPVVSAYKQKKTEEAVRGELKGYVEHAKRSASQEFTQWMAENGLSSDDVLTNGQTVSEYYDTYIGEVETAAKEAKEDVYNSATEGAGYISLSHKDIYGGSVKVANELKDYLIPYAASTKGALATADGLRAARKAYKAAKAAKTAAKGGKAATIAAKESKVLTETAKTGEKILTADGKKLVKDSVEKILKSDNKQKAFKEVFKTINKSTLKENVKRELLANVIQDVSIGAPIDLYKGGTTTDSPEELAKYMAFSGAANLVLGGAMARVAGRTGKSGKQEIKEGMAAVLNDELKLSKSDASELMKLSQKAEKSGLTPAQNARFSELKDMAVESVKVNKRGKLVSEGADELSNVMTTAEVKRYIHLKSKESAGVLTRKDVNKLKILNKKAEAATVITRFNTAKNVSDVRSHISAPSGKDVKTLKDSIRYYDKMGMAAEKRQTENLLKTVSKKYEKSLGNIVSASKKISGDFGREVVVSGEKDIVESLARTGRSVEDPSLLGGFVERDINGEVIAIHINKDSEHAVSFSLGHELSHVLETVGEEYNTFKGMLKKFVGDEWDSELEYVSRQYDSVPDAKFENEVVGNLAAKHLFGEESSNFFDSLVEKNPSLFERIRDFIRKIIGKSKEENSELKALDKKMSELYEKAVAKRVNTEAGASEKSLLDELSMAEERFATAKTGGRRTLAKERLDELRKERVEWEKMRPAAEKFYEEIKPLQKDLDSTLQKAASKLGYEFNPFVPKTVDSMLDKVVRRGEAESVEQIDDAVRNVIIMRSFGESVDAISTVEKELQKNGFTILERKVANKHAATSGYRGLHLKVEKNGVGGEVQFSTKAHWDVKNKSELIYAETRPFEKRNDLTRDENKWLARKYDESLALWATIPKENAAFDAIASEIKNMGDYSSVGKTPSDFETSAHSTGVEGSAHSPSDVRSSNAPDSELNRTVLPSSNSNESPRVIENSIETPPKNGNNIIPENGGSFKEQNGSKNVDMLYGGERSVENVGSKELSEKLALAKQYAKAAEKEFGRGTKEYDKERLKIFKETRWFQGWDGKWRYEIDDSRIGFVNGKKMLSDLPVGLNKKSIVYINEATGRPEINSELLADVNSTISTLSKKETKGTITKAEKNALQKARTQLSTAELYTKDGAPIGAIIKHKALFDMYPELQTEVRIRLSSDGEFADIPASAVEKYRNYKNRVAELEEKEQSFTITDEEYNELQTLYASEDEYKYGGVYAGATTGNIITINANFLREGTNYNEYIKLLGQDPQKKFNRTLVHELQHELQGREDFAAGSTPENYIGFYDERDVLDNIYPKNYERDFEKINALQEKREDIGFDMDSVAGEGTYDDFLATFRDLKSELYNKKLLDQKIYNLDKKEFTSYMFTKLKKAGALGDSADNKEFLSLVKKYLFADYDAAQIAERNPDKLYFRTAGEREAREVSDRLYKDAEQEAIDNGATPYELDNITEKWGSVNTTKDRNKMNPEAIFDKDGKRRDVSFTSDASFSSVTKGNVVQRDISTPEGLYPDRTTKLPDKSTRPDVDLAYGKRKSHAKTRADAQTPNKDNARIKGKNRAKTEAQQRAAAERGLTEEQIGIKRRLEKAERVLEKQENRVSQLEGKLKHAKTEEERTAIESALAEAKKGRTTAKRNKTRLSNKFNAETGTTPRTELPKGEKPPKKPKTKAEEIKHEEPTIEERIENAKNGYISAKELGEHAKRLGEEWSSEVDETNRAFREAAKSGELGGKLKRTISYDDAYEKALKDVEEDLGKVYDRVMSREDFDVENTVTAAEKNAVLVELIKRAGQGDENAALMHLKVIDKMDKTASLSGHMLQLQSYILRNSPEGRLRYVMREIKRMNTEYEKALKGKEVSLTPQQIQRILDAKDPLDVAKTMEDIGKELWKQVPAGKFETLNQIRHFSMLFNPKTHGRNVFGNTVFAGARMVSDTIEVSLARAAKGRIEKLSGLSKYENELAKVESALAETGHTPAERQELRSKKALLNKRIKQAKDEIKDPMLNRVTMSERKACKKILKERFDVAYATNQTSSSRWAEGKRSAGYINEQTNSKVRNWIADKGNKAIDVNYALLDVEDKWFFAPAFRTEYMRYCKSKGFTETIDGVPTVTEQSLKDMSKSEQEAATAWAMQEAKIATFRDDSAISKRLIAWKNATETKAGVGAPMYRALNVGMEAVLPFVKTPVNIMRRGMDYSPIGLFRGVAESVAAKDVPSFMNGIHHLSTGLTGTGVLVIGMWAASHDWVTVEAGDVSGDEYYDRDMGYQDYSIVLHPIKIFGKDITKDSYSLSLDWMAPMQFAFFQGAAVYNSICENGISSISDVIDVLEKAGGATASTFMNMSFMSSGKDTIESFVERAYRDGSGNEATVIDAATRTLFGTLPTDWLSGFAPQLMNQTAGFLDDKMRDTSSTNEDEVVKVWETFGRQMQNRIPIFRESLNPKINRKGEDVSNEGENILTKLANSFINPATVKKITMDKYDEAVIETCNDMDEEDRRKTMMDFTGSPFYDIKGEWLGKGKKDQRMTYDERTDYLRVNRGAQWQGVKDMVDSKSYRLMDSSMKADEIKDWHYISTAMADQKVYGDKYAKNKIVANGSKYTKDNWKRMKTFGGNAKDFVDSYVAIEKLGARAHADPNDYHTIAVAIEGMKFKDKKVGKAKRDMLEKSYAVFGDKIEPAKAFFSNFKNKDKGLEEYAECHCAGVSECVKSGVDATTRNLSIGLATAQFDDDFKVPERTYRAMGYDWQSAQAGGGLKKYGYSYNALDKMQAEALVNFDEDHNNRLTKEETVAYIESLGITNNDEKACLFQNLYGSGANNPYGIIKDHLKWGTEPDDVGGSGRGGWGHGGWGHGGGGGGGGGGTMPKTASGAIDGKVTDPFAKTSNTSSASNLNDAYRKKVKKLRAQSRKH